MRARWFPFAIGTSLAISLMVLLNHFAFDWGQAEDFHFVDWYRRFFVSNEWQLPQLLNAQNGPHLQGFQALLGVLIFRLFGIHFIYLTYLNWLLCLACAFVTHRLANADLVAGAPRILAPAALVLVFFFPAQVNHLLWPYEVGWFFVTFALLTNLWLVEHQGARALPLVALLALCGTTSSAQGLFLWPAAALHYLSFRSDRHRWLWTAFMLAGFVFSLALMRLLTHVSPTSTLPGIAEIGHFIVYLIQIAGSIFGVRTAWVCLFFGSLICAAAAVYVWRSLRTPAALTRLQRTALVMITYSALAIVGFAIGRWGFGIPWALDRVHAAPLITPGMAGLLLLALNSIKPGGTSSQKARLAGGVACAFFLLPTFTSLNYAYERAQDSRSARAFAMFSTCRSLEPHHFVVGVNSLPIQSHLAEDNFHVIQPLCTVEVPPRVAALTHFPDHFACLAASDPATEPALRTLWNVYTYHYDLQHAFPISEPGSPRRLIEFAANNAATGSQYETELLAPYATVFLHLPDHKAP